MAKTESKARPLDEFPDLVDVLPDMCEEYRKIQDQIVKLEDRKKALSSDICALMEAAEASSINGPDWTAVRAKGTHTSLNKEKLVMAGVSLETIARCTDRKEYFYAQVRRREEGVAQPSV